MMLLYCKFYIITNISDTEHPSCTDKHHVSYCSKTWKFCQVGFLIYSVPVRFCFSFGYIAYTKALFAITLPPLTIILFKDTYSSANPLPTPLRKGNAHLNIVQSLFSDIIKLSSYRDVDWNYLFILDAAIYVI